MEEGLRPSPIDAPRGKHAMILHVHDEESTVVYSQGRYHVDGTVYLVNSDLGTVPDHGEPGAHEYQVIERQYADLSSASTDYVGLQINWG